MICQFFLFTETKCSVEVEIPKAEPVTEAETSQGVSGQLSGHTSEQLSSCVGGQKPRQSADGSGKERGGSIFFLFCM